MGEEKVETSLKEELEKAIGNCTRTARWGAEVLSAGEGVASIRTASPHSTDLLAYQLRQQGFKTWVISRNMVGVKKVGGGV